MLITRILYPKNFGFLDFSGRSIGYINHKNNKSDLKSKAKSLKSTEFEIKITNQKGFQITFSNTYDYKFYINH